MSGHPMPILPAQILALSLIGSAAAGAPPRFDIAAICQRRVVFDRTPATIESCRGAEQNALDELTRNWASYPEEFSSRCSAENTSSQPSYVDVVECINMGVLNQQGRLDPPIGGVPPNPPNTKP